jgi:hypothetical protein
VKKKTDLLVPDMKELEKSLEGDTDLILFYVSWLKNGLNASKAYKELHPDVTDGSSEVLGSRWLGRVKDKIGLQTIMSVYGLDMNMYLLQLKDGVRADKRDQYSGEMYPDHQTRLKYHDKLGKLLGLEVDSPTTAIAIKGEDMSIQFIEG